MIKTKISPAKWCSATGSFEDATGKYFSKSSVCWMDQLLEGGIALPPESTSEESAKRPLLMLVSGSPGTGKSTFCLEFCYRLAAQGERTLYITTEADSGWATSKAHDFGWDEHKFTAYTPHKDREPAESQIAIMPLQKAPVDVKSAFSPKTKINGAYSYIIRTLTKITGLPNPKSEIIQARDANTTEKAVEFLIDDPKNTILIVDSLNTIKNPEEQTNLFNAFTQLSGEIKIICLVMDSAHDPSNYWAHVSDLVLQFGWEDNMGYLTRCFSIDKARYQEHAWGKHQLKICRRYEKSNVDGQSLISKKRAHPFREEGGIAIYPSIHFYLSKYKRETPKQDSELIPTHLCEFDSLLTKHRDDSDSQPAGFPKGKCSGFIGTRGGHKSHLGYTFLLEHLARGTARGIVISLRDDEGIARGTMKSILHKEILVDDSAAYKCRYDIVNHEGHGDLEIIYFPPGYITPSEFFHRVFLSIQRLKKLSETKQDNKDVILIFNSLDQLPSRFPLCAKEQIFIPGLIAMLNDEEITSVFIGVQEAGQPEQQYGLLSMADALFGFRPTLITKDNYQRNVMRLKHPNSALIKSPDKWPELVQTTVIEVLRYSGGKAAGGMGLLDLVDDADSWKTDLRDTMGLNFTPCQPFDLKRPK